MARVEALRVNDNDDQQALHDDSESESVNSIIGSAIKEESEHK